MQQDRFKKARLTIQQCSFPHRNSNHNVEGRQRVSTQPKRISYAVLSNSLEKKTIEGNPEMSHYQKMSQILKNNRKSEPNEVDKQQKHSNLMDLPSIRNKMSINSARDNNEAFKSYSSSKLTVGPYRKIQNLFSSRYCSKIQSLKKIDPSQPKKLITVSQFNSEDIVKPNKEEIKRKTRKELTFMKAKISKMSCKNHLNRVRNQIAFAEELQSRKCQKSQYDNDNFNLRLKNVLRFQFDPLQLTKIAKPKNEKNVGTIQGWRAQREMDQSAGLCYY